MRLYLLRHGHAPSAAEAGVPTDAERPLSAKGRDMVRKMARHLLKLGGRPSSIVHSPFRRAAETAREAAEIIKPASGLLAFAPLSNAMPAEELYDQLKPILSKESEVLAVGHQPQLGEFAAFLCGNIFELRAGGLIALELKEAPRAAALWSVNPEDIEG